MVGPHQQRRLPLPLTSSKEGMPRPLNGPDGQTRYACPVCGREGWCMTLAVLCQLGHDVRSHLNGRLPKGPNSVESSFQDEAVPPAVVPRGGAASSPSTRPSRPDGEA